MALHQRQKINQQIHASNAKDFPKSTVYNFIRKYKIKLRRIQRQEQVHKSSYLGSIMRWYLTLREGRIKTETSKPSYDENWGRFKPNRRFNVDQVARVLSFVICFDFVICISRAHIGFVL